MGLATVWANFFTNTSGHPDLEKQPTTFLFNHLFALQETTTVILSYQLKSPTNDRMEGCGFDSVTE
jgi:hypothetical protein